MRWLRFALALLGLYVLVVIGFEAMLGYFQPKGSNTIVITTTDASGDRHTRVVSRLDHDGRIHIAANHWPREWYRQVLANPKLEVELPEGGKPFTAVPVSDAEHDALMAAHPHGLGFRILTGFPPRRFVRLEPSMEAGMEAGMEGEAASGAASRAADSATGRSEGDTAGSVVPAPK